MNILKGVFSRFHNASLIKKISIILVVGVLIFLLSKQLLGGNTKSQISTDTVKVATIVDTVSESGNIQSNQLTVYSISSGIIEELYVKNGDAVKKGDKLFKVKSTASDQDKASAYASYLSAKNSLASAQAKINSLQAAEFKANQTFMNGKGSSNDPDKSDPTYIQENANWLQAEADYKNQAIAISQAQAALNSASLSYQATQDSIVTAQVAGTIANVSYSVGDQVTASMNTSSNTNTSASSVLVIGTETENVIKIQINEVDVNKVKVGQEATITISAIKDKTYSGEVTRVDDYGTDTSGVITYNVYVKVKNPDEQIRPLMSAVVVIQTTKHENALVVPNSAVKPYKGGKAVQVKDTSKPGNQLKYVQVKTGIKNTSQTEILEGLTQGTQIVTGTTATTTTKSSGGMLGGPPGN
jgi:HlyD family secretion protein